MVPPPDTGAKPAAERWLEELRRLDVATYAAVAATPTPTLDVAFRRLSRAADHSKLWLATCAVMVRVGGDQGRRAARDGLASIALTSATVNLMLKPLARRRRPSRETHDVPVARQVTMPRSTSWPSGHAASAFAFAAGVGAVAPGAALPLTGLAALVAYSRVHTGVHYPADVIAGAVTGAAMALLGLAAVPRRRPLALER